MAIDIENPGANEDELRVAVRSIVDFTDLQMPDDELVLIIGGDGSGEGALGAAATLKGGAGGIGAQGGSTLVEGGQGEGAGVGGNATIRGGGGGAGGSAILVAGAGGAEGGSVQITAGSGDEGGSVFIIAGDSTNGPGRNINIETTSSSGENLNGGDIMITLGVKSGSGRDGLIIVTSLPTANPNVDGALWSDSGTLKVSAG